jgi:hypothetical protein
MALRAIEPSDWEAWTGRPAPPAMIGIADANDYMIEGLGVIYLADDDRWWLTFARAPGVRKVKTAHRMARHLISVAIEAGMRVHALADPRRSGSELWIERLGFVKSDETMGGFAIWRTR